MNTEPLHGIYPIIYTAFHDDGRIDEASQRRLVDFLIQSGAHGLAPCGGASETGFMTMVERRALLEVCAEQTAGRVPLVMGCTAESTEDSLVLVRHGAALGVRAAFGLLPKEQQSLKGEEQAQALRRHYLALGEGSPIPIMVQEVGTPIPPEVIVEIAERCPNVCYVKEEAPDAGHRMTRLLELSGGSLRIFSGGLNLLDDLHRGAIGAIPGSIGIADLATAYNRHVAGDRAGARQAFNHFLPLSHWRRQFHPHGTKEVLRRLGVFSGIHNRQTGGQPLDERDLHELDEIMALMGTPY
jgi:4-hydroxy-tetrahydrodipicolinate synthase